MNKPANVITLLVLVALITYLFVQAPAPLSEEDTVIGESIPIETVFQLVAAENDIVRALWTREIVGMGKKSGLKFDEDWRDKDVQAGPLPALFLREAATSLEKNIIRLSLFLGSDFPINQSNLFLGLQKEAFEKIKNDHLPQFFYTQDTQLFTGMFPDYASVQPCVSCHNDHPDSPKTDWVLNDVMGATTWSYPKEAVSRDELMKIIASLRKGFRDAYTAYIEKVATFSRKPEIGTQWPRDGYFLPSVDTFMNEFSKRASQSSMELLLYKPVNADKKANEVNNNTV